MLTSGPPPAAPAHSIPSIPAIHLLTAAIIRSDDRLFFVSHNIGANDAREWRLARVAFQDSMSLYPSCTLDGRFLFEFYICHPADWRYNAVNQRYWLQFHGREDILHPSLSTDTHLVKNPPPAPGRLFLGVAISSASGRDLTRVPKPNSNIWETDE